ncbi:MAG: hypothetical protein LBI05_06440 [Planctomycetaceae bacterium]|jgi:hypothetical protein|nr:hypothetical protein [Planctomycetaceae bacterium]
MADQFLSTFHVQPNDLTIPVAVTAAIQTENSSTHVWSDVAAFRVDVGERDPDGRYRIDVYRKESYRYTAAGTNSGQTLRVLFNGGGAITRLLYVTVQPNVRVYREDGTDILTTRYSNTTSNPANYHVEYELSGNEINLTTENEYKDKVFIVSNQPINAYSASFASGWFNTYSQLMLDDKFCLSCKGGTGYLSLGTNNTVSLLSMGTTSTVEIGLEKSPLALVFYHESQLELQGTAVNRYTGSGMTTESRNYGITIPLMATLTMPHEFALCPDVLTLDEENNYTSFVTVDTNEEATWKFSDVPSELTVEPSEGVGRTAVVVKAASDNPSPTKVTLSAESMYDGDTGDTEESMVEGIKLTDTTDVYLEKYTETTNALIPRKTDGEAWQSFDQTLKDYAAVGSWQTGNVVDLVNPEYNHENFPTIAVTLDEKHRIRSWSLQSPGIAAAAGEACATSLILSGLTADGWKILDYVILPQSYINYGYQQFVNNTEKPREDRKVHHRELVKELRISAVAASPATAGLKIGFPKIQVFAGEPVMPKMSGNTSGDFTVDAPDSRDGSMAAWRIFDRTIGGSIASAGNGSWYINLRDYPREGVATSGAMEKVSEKDLQSMRYLTIKLPGRRLLGFLYSVDVASLPTFDNKKPAFAASLYFEGRKTHNKNSDTMSSSEGEWDEVGLISIDKCTGHNPEGTDFAIDQPTLDTYAHDVLGLTGNDRHHAYFVNRNGQKIIQCIDGTWKDVGNWFSNATDPISNADNRTHYADFKTVMTLAQFRFTVKSLMNIVDPPNSTPVAMPEMQFFGLPDPAQFINQNAVARMPYLFAEGMNSKLYDVLGRHKRLPSYSNSSGSSTFRFCVGNTENCKLNSVLSSSGSTSTINTPICLDIYSLSTGAIVSFSSRSAAKRTIAGEDVWFCSFSFSTNYETTRAYYEVYTWEAESGEKVILSSGYSGTPT